MAGSGNVSWGIQLEGVSTLNKALRVLQEDDLPILREALTKSGRLLQSAAASRAPGGIGRSVDFAGIRGTKAGIRALVRIDHPGGRSMEFGRIWYYRANAAGRSAQIEASLRYSPTEARRARAERRLSQLASGVRIGNNRPGSKRRKGSMVAYMQRYRVGDIGSAGQRPRPYLGIINRNAAIGAVEDDVERLLTAAIRDEWNRLVGRRS